MIFSVTAVLVSLLSLSHHTVALPAGLSSRDTSASDMAQYLSSHNSVRAQHGAAALNYNQQLARAAESWADRCVFEHSGGSLGPFGENLAAGTGNFPISSAVKSWTDEVSEYDPNNPQPSHFTQVVWKSTTDVGCAEVFCNNILGGAAYYVCEYFPAGNVLGQFDQNVQA